MWSIEHGGQLRPHIDKESAAHIIYFASSTDGRGFSEAELLRRRHPTQRIVAYGELLPDQLALAFACGINVVLVSDDQLLRHGRQAWLDAARQDRQPQLYSARRQAGIWSSRDLA